MTNFYNMMFGKNPKAEHLVATLNKHFSPDKLAMKIPRFRDAHLTDGFIVVTTRTGGWNREGYEQENEAMRSHPWYDSDEDDIGDETYAYFYFKIPDSLGK